jgi:predicted nuclease with TOPRIM domain
MINIDEIENLDKEIQEQTNLLKTNTTALEDELKEFKEIQEALSLLEEENHDLEQRLIASEAKYADLKQQITELEGIIEKRDNVMKFLLKTVGELNNNVNKIRSSLNSQNKDA